MRVRSEVEAKAVNTALRLRASHSVQCGQLELAVDGSTFRGNGSVKSI